MDIQSMITLFSGVALLAAKPGPGMMTVATKAMGEGISSVLYFMVGTNLVKIMFFTLVVFGYSSLPQEADFLALFLKCVTALYLIWLGVQGLRKADLNAKANQYALGKPNFWENFSAGFMLTISNPFDILFFAGILPAIFTMDQISPLNYFTAALVIVTADAVVALSYAVPIALTRKFFTRKVMRNLNVVSSVGIIVVGLIIAYSALPI